jgi:hypothetical protein
MEEPKCLMQHCYGDDFVLEVFKKNPILIRKANSEMKA